MAMSRKDQRRCREACEDCGEGASRYNCLRCSKVLCEQCRDGHRRNKHPLMLLFSLSHGDGQEVGRVREEEVGKGREGAEEQRGETYNTQCAGSHSSHPVTHYCSSCCLGLCTLCLASDPHLRHDVTELADAAQRARAELSDAHLNVERCLRRLRAALADAQLQQQSVTHDLNAAEDGIRQRAAEARAVVDKHEREALDALRHKGEKLMKKTEGEVMSVDVRAAAVMAMWQQLDNTLQSSHDVQVINMQHSAKETISRDDYFTKFTSDLPDTTYEVETHHEEFSRLEAAARAYIGKKIFNLFNSLFVCLHR